MKVAKTKKAMTSKSIIQKNNKVVKINKDNTKKWWLSIDDINRNFFWKLIINNNWTKKSNDNRIMFYTDH